MSGIRDWDHRHVESKTYKDLFGEASGFLKITDLSWLAFKPILRNSDKDLLIQERGADKMQVWLTVTRAKTVGSSHKGL